MDSGYTFAHYVRRINPQHVSGGEQKAHHTADAMRFFHAVHDSRDSGERATLKVIPPKLVEIAERHMQERAESA